MNIKNIQQMSDEDFKKKYISIAKSASENLSFYQSEFNFRIIEKSGKRMELLTWAIFFLTLINVGLFFHQIFYG